MSLDLFNIDSKCNIAYCSIVLLAISIVVFLLLCCLTFICCRKLLRKRRVGNQNNLEQQVMNIMRNKQMTEANLCQPKNNLQTEYSGQNLYKFAEPEKEEDRGYMEQLVKQIELETVEIKKITMKRKRIMRKRFFQEERTPDARELDTVQEEAPSFHVSSIEVKPSSPISISLDFAKELEGTNG